MIPLNTYSGILAPTIFKVVLSQEGYEGTVGGWMTWWAEMNYKPDSAPIIVIDISGGANPIADNHREFPMVKSTDTSYKYDWQSYYSPPQFDYDQLCTAYVKATYKGKVYQSQPLELEGDGYRLWLSNNQ